MNDEQYKDMVITHDKHLDKLTDSVSMLVGNVKSTNEKLEDVITVITQQNVLQERMANLDHNFRESFERVHKRTDIVEKLVRNTVSATTIKWAIGIFVVYSVSFGSFVITDLQSLRILAVEKIQMQRQINKNVNEKINKLTKLHTKD
jgi:hypothetical protein